MFDIILIEPPSSTQFDILLNPEPLPVTGGGDMFIIWLCADDD